LDYTEIAIPAGWDGLTELPAEPKLRELRFTDHNPKEWRFSRPMGSEIFFTVNIKKEGIDGGNGRLLHAYKELIIDEDFGQPTPLGGMNPEFRASVLARVSGALKELRQAGISVTVNPGQYYWEDWDGGLLAGAEGELDLVDLQGIRKHSEEFEDEEPAEQESGVLQLSNSEAVAPIGITAQELKQIADLIDSEIENLSWDSLAHSMTAGEYVAPTVIRAYLKLIGEKK